MVSPAASPRLLELRDPLNRRAPQSNAQRPDPRRRTPPPPPAPTSPRWLRSDQEPEEQLGCRGEGRHPGEHQASCCRSPGVPSPHGGLHSPPPEPAHPAPVPAGSPGALSGELVEAHNPTKALPAPPNPRRPSLARPGAAAPHLSNDWLGTN